MKKIKIKLIAGVFVCGLALTTVMTSKLVTTIVSADETTGSMIMEEEDAVPATLAYFTEKAQQGDQRILNTITRYQDQGIAADAIVLILENEDVSENEYDIYTDTTGTGQGIAVLNDNGTHRSIDIANDPAATTVGAILEAVSVK